MFIPRFYYGLQAGKIDRDYVNNGEIFCVCCRVNHKSAELKVNIFDMAGHPIFYEVCMPSYLTFTGW